MAHNVEIINISLGGAAIKTDRELDVGKEYSIKLECMSKSIDLKGIIIHCESSNIDAISAGEKGSRYTAGMMFKDISSKTIIDFINSIE